MNRKIFYFISILLYCSCQSEKKEVIYETIQHQLLNDEFMTRMPGNLLVNEKYIVWEDPFARDTFVNVHDRTTGQLLGKMGKVGEGPGEFITGSMSGYSIDNKVFAIDVNGTTKGYLSIDSLLAGKQPLQLLTVEEKESRPALTEIEADVFFGTTEDGEEDYFKANIHGKESTFGVYPVKEVKQHLGCEYAYDARTGHLVCSSFTLPYLALYQKQGEKFVLKWEQAPKGGYKMQNERLVADKGVRGSMDVSLTKDYIAVLAHDDKEELREAAQTTGRQESALPHTLLLYDYNGNLLKVIELGMRVLRIASDCSGNTLYAMGLNPEFALVKYEL